ncbi:hypothetical protein N7447_008540 [Penicillium robsamsonii]|uniref:uncharacterized protein n=1 Tax=Penicillium robsamsonii TaxID=1792511 RepID=UPI0025477F86|nr:uncharacterized protein N7447_008540 [Penicillium robsamsonii]KAJ5816307.1 hypothetical protein N7447_008540 [Penicillium robsamsonii]
MCIKKLEIVSVAARNYSDARAWQPVPKWRFKRAERMKWQNSVAPTKPRLLERGTVQWAHDLASGFQRSMGELKDVKIE